MKLSKLARVAVFTSVILGRAPGVSAAEPKKPLPTFMKAEDGGIDFKLQGEYVADKLGAQVVALAEGKFRVLFFPGGLPGAGWDGKTRIETDGELAGEKAVFAGAWPCTVDGERLEGRNDKGEPLSLKKTLRQSPTLGAKPPEAAVVLFDGTSADAWSGTDAKLVEGNLLHMGINSRKAFGSFTVHAEFRTPFMPSARSMARGNSGICLQNRYEVQTLDSFGFTYPQNPKRLLYDCGAIYGLAAPSVNACLPPLSWQTFDIDFTAATWDGDKKTANARATVKLNGVTIFDDFEIPSSTFGKESAGPGTFQIQNHSDPVYWRNIWVVEK